ncbi:hypothetical protein LTR97_003383 [Elasticomyces elasticus]|uniref:Heterokaryon incompatibility domain-containing protein n=1 Tax=Elasticomyces elasticus TaxID=574655 RepID=A0AAN7WP71_9PEZI|nr:hypothetical protein LTR97_003383 [Elasticomyces elasticus]
MRLIEVNTFKMREFSRQETIPEYAILSHRWGDDEVDFKAFQDLDRASNIRRFDKIQGLCEQAKRDRINYVCLPYLCIPERLAGLIAFRVDTACIDKSSSWEYDEAINSIYRWYAEAKICYVYLFDVPENCATLQDPKLQPSQPRLDWSSFESSVWFQRVWTLQELIAPEDVCFFNHDWRFIGALASMIERVSRITNIPTRVLDHSQRPCDFSIAQKLSWAAMRTTTFPEDEAYALFGILEVNMPPVRNEGQGAFLRLQEYIIERSMDQTIFAWDVPQPRPGEDYVPSDRLLAPSPRCFFNGSRIRRRSDGPVEAAYELNNKGLEIKLPILRTMYGDDIRPSYTLGVLDCEYQDSSQTLALIMSPHPTHGDSSLEYYVSGSFATQGGRRIYSRLSQVSERAHTARAKHVTITKDRQSQKYMKALGANDPSCFAVKLTSNELNQRLTLRDFFPRVCWDPSSSTLRLHPRQYPVGGVVVALPDGRSALIGFQATAASSPDLHPSRSLCDMAFIDSGCFVEPHLANLPARRGSSGVLHAKSLPLNEAERLYALLEHGLLIVSVERTAHGTRYVEALTGLPNMSQKVMHTSTPNGRRLSEQDIERPGRRLSVVGDRQTSRGQQWQATRSSSYDYSPNCANCRDKSDAERLAKRRQADDEDFRRRQENQRQAELRAARRQEGTWRQTAKNVVAGGTLASIMVRRSGDSSDED